MGANPSYVRSSKFFLSYAHDKEGKELAAFLYVMLKASGFTVVWDGQMTFDNPASKAEWIVNAINECVVICVLSPDYVRRFGRGDSSPDRKGVLFEGRHIMEKYYNHTESNGCPVVVVARPDFSADLLPYGLRGLVISRINPLTVGGGDPFVRRLSGLHAAPVLLSVPADDAVHRAVVADAQPTGNRPLTELLRSLEVVFPGTVEAGDLVREWIAVARASPGGTDFTRAFPAVVRIVKFAGDVRLAAEVADLCLAALTGDELLKWEKKMRAEVLISMKCWQLRREGKLRAALTAVGEGLTLARECRAAHLVALGEGSLGRVHRGLAEVAESGDLRRHLDDAVRFTSKAIEAFKGMGQHDEEVGVYCNVLARVYFTRRRLLGERKSLSRASGFADLAAEFLPEDRVRECFELRILRAEIAMARRSPQEAREYLNGVIADLREREFDGASYTELLGRAYQARAELRRIRQGRGMPADVDEAQRIFEVLGLAHSVAECGWLRIKVTSSWLSGRDIRILERLCADARVRLGAVDERLRRIERGIRGSRSRKAEWRDIVDQVRRRG